MGRIKYRVVKTVLAVRRLRHSIALEHFQGDLAAATLTGDLLDLLQHFLAQPQAPKLIHHGDRKSVV